MQGYFTKTSKNVKKQDQNAFYRKTEEDIKQTNKFKTKTSQQIRKTRLN